MKPKILFCAATGFELAALRPAGEIASDLKSGSLLRASNGDLLAVTGVGGAGAAAAVAGVLRRFPEVSGIVAVGIAGAYSRGGAGEQLVARAETVRVVSDRLVDAGAWDGDKLILPEGFPFETEWRENSSFLKSYLLSDLSEIGDRQLPGWAERVDRLLRVEGATVDGSTGSYRQAELRGRFGAVTESLEGAHLFALANALGVGAVQVRGVSNLCGPRDRDSWRVSEAIDNLRSFFEGAVGPVRPVLPDAPSESAPSAGEGRR